MVLICDKLTLTPAVTGSVRGRQGSERRQRGPKGGGGGKKDGILCVFSHRKKIDWHVFYSVSRRRLAGGERRPWGEYEHST